MTVAELLAALQSYDPKARVFFEHGGDYYPLRDLYLETDDQQAPGSAENRRVGP
jgi:hypothetical protein